MNWGKYTPQTVSQDELHELVTILTTSEDVSHILQNILMNTPVQLMVAGVSGVHGQSVQRHVDQGQEAETEHVTTHFQLMGENTVWDKVKNQENVIQTLAQV